MIRLVLFIILLMAFCSINALGLDGLEEIPLSEEVAEVIQRPIGLGNRLVMELSEKSGIKVVKFSIQNTRGARVDIFRCVRSKDYPVQCFLHHGSKVALLEKGELPRISVLRSGEAGTLIITFPPSGGVLVDISVPFLLYY